MKLIDIDKLDFRHIESTSRQNALDFVTFEGEKFFCLDWNFRQKALDFVKFEGEKFFCLEWNF